MKIASRPAHFHTAPFRSIDCESPLSSDSAEIIGEARQYEETESSDVDNGSVVFVSSGRAGKNLTAGRRYNFFVQLSAEELLKGITSLPVEIVESTVAAMLQRTRESGQGSECEEPSRRPSPRQNGQPTPRDVIATANAIARGLVDSLANDRDGTMAPIAASDILKSRQLR